MCRLFCPRRLTPLSRTRPVSMKDCAMLVENPSIRTPATNATSTTYEFLWNMLMPGGNAL